MARNTGAALNTFALWKKLLSVYCLSEFIIYWFSFCSGIAGLSLGTANAFKFSARSSWLDSTPLPDDCYLSPRVNSLFQPLFVLTVFTAISSPLCTVAFFNTIFRRQTTHTEALLVIAVITINIAVVAIVLALQTLIQPSLDMQNILRSRPDLSSEDVLFAWDHIMGGGYPLGLFVLSLVTGGYQVMAVSLRHLIPSPWRLPKQFQPYVMEKRIRRHAIGEPGESTQGTELVAGVDCGPLASLFDDYEKRGLISTHIDLESFDMNNSTRPRVNETLTTEEINSRRAFQEVNPLGRAEDGPQFALSDRYWGPNRDRGKVRALILVIIVYSLLAVGFETARFTSTRTSNEPRQWLYILGVIYPWPLLIWVVTVLISVQYRIAFQRKVLGRIRVDVLLSTSGIITLIPALFHGIAMLIRDDLDDPQVSVIWDSCTTAYSFVLITALSFRVLSRANLLSKLVN